MASRISLSRAGGLLGARQSLVAGARQPQASVVSRRHASGGGQYNEPSGYLFGEKPPAPGQKRKWEDWELLWYTGMFGGLALGTVLYIYKPKNDIGSWAEKEARKRLDERGEWRYKPQEKASS